MPRQTDSKGDPITWRTCAIRLREDQIIPIFETLAEKQQWRLLLPHLRRYNGEKFSDFQINVFNQLSVTSSAKMVINVWFTQIPTVAKMRRVFAAAGLNHLVSYMERLVSDGAPSLATAEVATSEVDCEGATGTAESSSMGMAPFITDRPEFRPHPAGSNPPTVSTYRLEFFEMEVVEKVTDNFSRNYRIGEGSFGGVYRANIGGRTVAVKRLAGASPYFRSHQTEYQSAVNYVSRLQHPHILKLLGHARGLDHRTHEEEFALIYEYMPLGDLAKHLQDEEMRKKMDYVIRFRIAEGTIAGLAYFNSQLSDHDRAYVHRDVKSANILLSEKYVPKLADFGCFTLGAKGTGESQVFESKQTIGTAPYMAPETRGLNGGEPIITTKGDTFAFGMVVLELFFGQLATTRVNFRKMAQNLQEPPDQSIQWGNQVEGSRLSVSPFLRFTGILCTVPEWKLRPETNKLAEIFKNRNQESLNHLLNTYKELKKTVRND